MRYTLQLTIGNLCHRESGPRFMYDVAIKQMSDFSLSVHKQCKYSQPASEWSQSSRGASPRSVRQSVKWTAEHTLMSIFTTASRCLSRDVRHDVIHTSFNPRRVSFDANDCCYVLAGGRVPCDRTKHVIRAVFANSKKRKNPACSEDPEGQGVQ